MRRMQREQRSNGTQHQHSNDQQQQHTAAAYSSSAATACNSTARIHLTHAPVNDNTQRGNPITEEEERSEELQGAEATRFRAVAARANYLAADRPDIQYAVKEVRRKMAKPVKGDWQKLVRLGRYLRGAPRCVLEYTCQSRCGSPTGFSDSDWAGDRKTGKSTSGGLIMMGNHLVKSWSRTQDAVTLSSAEAELVALGKLAMEVLGVRSMATEWQIYFFNQFLYI